jgi:hypothetical protein
MRTDIDTLLEEAKTKVEEPVTTVVADTGDSDSDDDTSCPEDCDKKKSSSWLPSLPSLPKILAETSEDVEEAEESA